NERSVSKRVKIGLAVMITWLLMPLLPAVNVTLFSPEGFLLPMNDPSANVSKSVWR
ncbi:flagellar biosynthetic protein FliR, partial [Pantoea agglomerans]|nr:flagellar biosynthetic protein FliR [Pantoea agglomerans]